MTLGSDSLLTPITCRPSLACFSWSSERCGMLPTHGGHHVAQNSSR